PLRAILFPYTTLFRSGGRRGRRSRHLTFWSRLAPARSIYDGETVWTEGRLSVYFLCGNANKIYLEALCDVMPLSFDGNSRICLRSEEHTSELQSRSDL